jgi:hypothetical protein
MHNQIKFQLENLKEMADFGGPSIYLNEIGREPYSDDLR